jgi:hypothetical protein
VLGVGSGSTDYWGWLTERTRNDEAGVSAMLGDLRRFDDIRRRRTLHQMEDLLPEPLRLICIRAGAFDPISLAPDIIAAIDIIVGRNAAVIAAFSRRSCSRSRRR